MEASLGLDTGGCLEDRRREAGDLDVIIGSVWLDMETGGQRGEGGLGHTHWNK